MIALGTIAIDFAKAAQRHQKIGPIKPIATNQMKPLKTITATAVVIAYCIGNLLDAEESQNGWIHISHVGMVAQRHSIFMSKVGVGAYEFA